MVKHQRAHYTIDARVRKRQAIGERLVELEVKALCPRLCSRALEYVGIAVDADKRRRLRSTGNRLYSPWVCCIRAVIARISRSNVPSTMARMLVSWLMRRGAPRLGFPGWLST
jgi:hypothetical protein